MDNIWNPSPRKILSGTALIKINNGDKKSKNKQKQTKITQNSQGPQRWCWISAKGLWVF